MEDPRDGWGPVRKCQILPLKDLIVNSSLQLKRACMIQSGAATLEEPMAAPASTDHHTIVAFKEKGPRQTRPLTFSS